MIEIINKQLLLQLVDYLCYWQMGFNSVFKGLKISVLTEYCSGDKIEKNEMGGACSAYGGKERCIKDFGGET